MAANIKDLSETTAKAVSDIKGLLQGGSQAHSLSKGLFPHSASAVFASFLWTHPTYRVSDIKGLLQGMKAGTSDMIERSEVSLRQEEAGLQHVTRNPLCHEHRRASPQSRH